MTPQREEFDIGHLPALMSFIEQVRESGESGLLTIGDNPVAVLHPVPLNVRAERLVAEELPRLERKR